MIRKHDDSEMTHRFRRFMPVSLLLVSACASFATPCPLQDPALAPTASTPTMKRDGGTIGTELRAMGCVAAGSPGFSAAGQVVSVRCSDGRVGYTFGQPIAKEKP